MMGIITLLTGCSPINQGRRNEGNAMEGESLFVMLCAWDYSLPRESDGKAAPPDQKKKRNREELCMCSGREVVVAKLFRVVVLVRDFQLCQEMVLNAF